ncbi:MAG: hypothetical protein JW841_00595 [Deltaproteobacteria bacterium]|nr:hypothetical protein [Deltaproteobacteria bacterium]
MVISVCSENSVVLAIKVGGIMELNKIMPKFEFNEIHSIRVHAAPTDVLKAIEQFTISEISRLVFLLLWLRELPSKLFSHRLSAGKHTKDIPALHLLDDQHGGFARLLIKTDVEIVYGFVSKFWKLLSEENLPITDTQSFSACNTPGFGKVACNFIALEDNDYTIVQTETRISAPDKKTLRKIQFYWRLIRLGSGLTRILMLRAIKRRAESLLKE